MSDHVKADLPSYFNGDLSEAKRQHVESHLGECASCRHVANKTRAKLARMKRQNLKDSMPDKVPNLLLTRLGRQMAAPPPPSPSPWGWIVLLLAVVLVVAWFVHRPSRVSGWWRGTSIGHSAGSADLTASTAAATGFEVDHSSPSQLRTDGNAAAAAGSVQESTGMVGSSANGGAPIAQWSGSESNVKDQRQVVVRSRPAWRQLWKEMDQPSPAPHLNFNDYVIVGIFAGERPAGQYQITLGLPIDQDDAVIIPYKVNGPAATAAPGSAPVHPYYLTAIQRSPKPIRFRQES